MTIKKSVNAPQVETLAAPLNPVGAANAPAQKGGSGVAVTLVLGLLSLAVVGVLTFMLWQHWDFLKGA